MKNGLTLILTALCITLTWTPAIFAQDSKAQRERGLINEIEYSPDGTKLAIASSYGIWLYDVKTGEELTNITARKVGALSIAFSPDGETIASGGFDKTVRLWDTADTDTGISRHVLSGHENVVCSIAFSPDGKTIVSGSWDKTLRLWDADTGKHLRTLDGHRDIVFSIAFSPDGKIIAAGSLGEVRLWDVNTGQHLRTIDKIGLSIESPASVFSVVFRPDGKIIATGDSDAIIYLWNVDTGKYAGKIDPLRPFNHPRNDHSNEDSINSLAFSPDGKMLAIGSHLTAIHLWDASTRRYLHRIGGQWEGVRSVAFSPDGKTITSASRSQVNLWDVDTGIHLRELSSRNLYGYSGSLPRRSLRVSCVWPSAYSGQPSE